MFIVSKAKYDEACRDRDIYKGERDGLVKRLEAGQRIQEADATRIRELKDRCNDLWAAYAGADTEAKALRERLAPFERTRGKGGRFVKADTQPTWQELENKQ